LKSIRSRLTYANVMSTIAVFLVLGGATAFAASHLAKNSVGTKQLQKNAVTAAKIKNGAVIAGKIADGAVNAGKIAAGSVGTSTLADGAVTGAKIGAGAVGTGKLGDGAVNGAKLSDGSVTAAKIGAGAVGTGKLGDGSVTANKLDPALSIPRVTQKLVGTGQVQFPTTSTSVTYPFDTPTFTQPAGEDELYIGAITVQFSAACHSPREFTAFLQEANPGALGGVHPIGSAIGEDLNGGIGEVTVTAQFGAIERGAMTMLASSAPTPHTFSVALQRIFCATGSPVGATATATSAQVDVIGFR
jgi:hypothetical protein